MDILVVGVLARLAAGSHRREPAFNFMLCAIGVLLLSDAIYGWRLLEGHFTPGALTSARLGRLLHAARHRGAAPVDAPALRARARGGPTLTRARLALLACASLTVPR